MSSPFDIFDRWYKEAEQAGELDPYQFVLSTSVDNQPRSRVVYWRDFVNQKFYFFTNYKSAKGEELEQNSKVSMNFHWRKPVHRQVRIQGTIAKAEAGISDRYFSSRPRGSQIGAWASPQSQKILDRAELERLVQETEVRFKDKEVPRPDFWGGYGITPDYFEFWEEGASRLHNRTVLAKSPQGWTQKIVAP